MRSAQNIPVLVSTARTPVGKFGGSLRDLDAVEIGGAAVAGALNRAPGAVPDHVFLGNVVQGGNGQNPARQAGVRGGLPRTVPATTLNDVCLASMTATGIAATMIRAGEIKTAVVGGFDSMSRALHGIQIRQAPRIGEPAMTDLLVRDGLWCALDERGMGEISTPRTPASTSTATARTPSRWKATAAPGPRRRAAGSARRSTPPARAHLERPAIDVTGGVDVAGVSLRVGARTPA